MRYSIITATKNAEDQIENSIKSGLSQNNVDLEHIIIDSVSKDNTIKIIDKYSSDQRIKYISEKDNLFCFYFPAKGLQPIQYQVCIKGINLF